MKKVKLKNCQETASRTCNGSRERELLDVRWFSHLLKQTCNSPRDSLSTAYLNISNNDSNNNLLSWRNNHKNHCFMIQEKNCAQNHYYWENIELAQLTLGQWMKSFANYLSTWRLFDVSPTKPHVDLVIWYFQFVCSLRPLHLLLSWIYWWQLNETCLWKMRYKRWAIWHCSRDWCLKTHSWWFIYSFSIHMCTCKLLTMCTDLIWVSTFLPSNFRVFMAFSFDTT